MLLLVLILVYFAAISPVLSLLWADSYHIQHLVLIVAAFNVLIFMVSCLYILTLSGKQIPKGIMYFFCGIVIFNCIGSVVGFANGYTPKLLNDFYLLIVGPTILVAVCLLEVKTHYVELYLKKFVSVAFIFVSLSVLAMLLQGFWGIDFYPSIATNALVITGAYFLCRKKYIFLFIVICVMLLSGKRSIVLVFIAILPFFVMILRGTSPIKSVIYNVMAGALLLTAVLYLTTLVPINSIDKFDSINPFSNQFDLLGGSAGERVQEVLCSLDASQKNPYSFVFGSGNGFTYPLYESSRNYYEQFRHGVHVIVIDYLTKYGVVFVIFIFIVMIMYFSKALHYLKYNKWCLNVMVYYQIFAVLNCFIGANLGLDLFFWCSIALTLTVMREYERKEENHGRL